MILVPVLPVLEARYVLMDLASAPAAKRNATVLASVRQNVVTVPITEKYVSTEHALPVRITEIFGRRMPPIRDG